MTPRNPFWGDLITDLRRQHGMSQRKLSELSSVPRNTLRKVETSDASVTIDALERVLDVFGYELTALDREIGTIPAKKAVLV